MDTVMSRAINQVAEEVYDTAVRSGWHTTDRELPEVLALIHSELSEALEVYRNHHPVTEAWIENGKPEGIPIELADAVIRIFDYCYSRNIDIGEAIRAKMAYNQTREYRHGGKKV